MRSDGVIELTTGDTLRFRIELSKKDGLGLAFGVLKLVGVGSAHKTTDHDGIAFFLNHLGF